MPSVEIICIGQLAPLDCTHMNFHVEAEIELRSHRLPSFFQADFDGLTGCIYHLMDEGRVTAYDLMQKDEDSERLRFVHPYDKALRYLLSELLSASPAGQVLFTSDYQFGPRRYQRLGALGLTEFWELHGRGCLWLNASYRIIRDC